VAELERKNAILEGQARGFNGTLRTAESSAKSLRDEATRLKTVLQQVRTQCASDIRKRDLQIQKMKERLSDTRRGTRPPASTIVISDSQHLGGSTLSRDRFDSTEPPRTLADDTTDFLTTLSQTLADENDNILALLRQCLSTLKAVQGLPDNDHAPQTEQEAEDALNPVVAPPANLESLSLEMDEVMASLQDMLNQPNYVPLEDLEEKNKEIVLLKQRNETLQEEWRKAIDLVDTWNKTLAGKTEGKEIGEKARDVPAMLSKKRPLRDIVNCRESMPRERRDRQVDPRSETEPQSEMLVKAQLDQEATVNNGTSRHTPESAEVESSKAINVIVARPTEPAQDSPNVELEKDEDAPRKRRRSSRAKAKLDATTTTVPTKTGETPPGSTATRLRRRSSRRKLADANVV